MTKLEVAKQEVCRVVVERDSFRKLAVKYEQKSMINKAMCMVMASALIVTNAAWLVIWKMG